ncbi:HD-GYP domain-containing protein [Niallia sp. 03133]|uniref:HD-GYP domain-containing protein n=1 Tax=Niallia sp. 03133 TaxID=3458060 RepID=UPI0040450363
MDMEHTTEPIIGNLLNDDIFSNSIQGLLLLKKGTILNQTHIELLEKHLVDPFKVIPSFVSNSISVEQTYHSLLNEVKKVFSHILKREEEGVEQLLSHFSKMVELCLHDFSTLDIIHKHISQSDYIYQHSINVGIISALIGNVLGYSKKNCQLLGQMGLFHDIGMLTITPSILKKEGKLTEKEYKEIQKHTMLGKSILFSITQLDILISRTALLHHERINGKGYPCNRFEKDIPFMIQIVSVADAFNSMCTSDLYKDKKTYFEAIDELISEAYGNTLNPAIVIPFTQFIMRKQLFKKVKLNNNETAEIIFIHQNEPHLPLVRLKNNYVDLRKASPLKITSLA